MRVKAGQFVAITTGEYSDYCLRDHLKALQDFDTTEVIERFFRERSAYLLLHPDIEDEDYQNQEIFLGWLVRMNYLEPLGRQIVEWHIGSYGELK